MGAQRCHRIAGLAKHLRGFGGPIFGNHDAFGAVVESEAQRGKQRPCGSYFARKIGDDHNVLEPRHCVIRDCGYCVLCGDVDAAGPYRSLLRRSGIWRRGRR